MGKYDACTIKTISEPAATHELDGVSFLGDGLERLIDACVNAIDRNNQQVAFHALCYGKTFPPNGRYSADISVLLPKSGKLYLHKIKIENADFAFTTLSYKSEIIELSVEVTIYPLPSAASACTIFES